MTHGACPTDYAGPRRSLILSGGGIRLSYQAGAVRALLESGLCFSHLDATSGGSINAAMLLSGLSPREMCRRWRTLDIGDTVSLMPPEQYLKTETRVAAGDADGMRDRVFPHLGIDLARVNRVTDLAGTFNVFNYSAKTNEVIPHQRLDQDLLVAGMSLPGVLPPVARGDTLYLDSAFVRDANLMEAVRRGAEELWVVWCLGNTARYRGGLLNLYVQMLEMSANGALNQELAQIHELNQRIGRGDSPHGQEQPVRVHLVKPEYPLPLDPELYLGRTDFSTLVDQGYADASKYLREMRTEGVPLTPESTRMREAGPGTTFRESLTGEFALGETDPAAGAARARQSGDSLALHLTVNLRDLASFLQDAAHSAEVVGHLEFPPLGKDLPLQKGRLNLFPPSERPDRKQIVYGLSFQHQGDEYYLKGWQDLHQGPGADRRRDITTLFATLHRGRDGDGPVAAAGVLRLASTDLAKLAATIHATGAGSIAEGGRAVLEFGRFFLGELWDAYAPRTETRHWWDRLWFWRH